MRLEVTQAHIDASDRAKRGWDPISVALRPYVADGYVTWVNTGIIEIRRWVRPVYRKAIRLDGDTAWIMTRWRVLGQPIEPFGINSAALDSGKWRKRGQRE